MLINFIFIPEWDMWFVVFAGFSVVGLISTVMVTKVTNPVGTILFFLLGIFNYSGLLLLLGFEFFALALLLIYAGAIMMLYLFVIMMIQLPVSGLQIQYLNGVKYLVLLFLMEIICAFQRTFYNSDLIVLYFLNRGLHFNVVDYLQFYLLDSRGLGLLLYSNFVPIFLLQGLVLLLALIGPISMTAKL